LLLLQFVVLERTLTIDYKDGQYSKLYAAESSGFSDSIFRCRIVDVLIIAQTTHRHRETFLSPTHRSEADWHMEAQLQNGSCTPEVQEAPTTQRSNFFAVFHSLPTNESWWVIITEQHIQSTAAINHNQLQSPTSNNPFSFPLPKKHIRIELLLWSLGSLSGQQNIYRQQHN
jgi:hypothetical protein